MNQNDIKERLNKLRDSLSDNYSESVYKNSLKEEGIKAIFIIPILHEFLNFTNIDEYKFEDIQGDNQNFADIVLRDNFLFETKRLNLLSDPNEKAKAEKQLRRYIKKENDNIHYGILTDGFLWELFVERKFIEKYANEGNKIAELDDEDVHLCLAFSIADQHFLNLIMMFHKDIYEENFKKIISRAIVNRATNKPGRVAVRNLFSLIDNTDIEQICGNYVQEQIDKYFRKEKGEFFDDIACGKMNADAKLKYEDEYLYIEVAVQKTGHIKVDPYKCRLNNEKLIEATQKMPTFLNLLTKTWPNSATDCIYPSRIDLIKALLDRRRLSKQEEILRNWKNL